MNAVILDGYTTNPGDLSWDWLGEYADGYTVYDKTAPEQIVERVQGCEIVITNKTRLYKPQIDRMPDAKYIGLLSTGFDAVDVAYARSRNIPVTNIPAYSTGGVAQLTFALVLEFTNRVALHDQAVKNGEWEKNGNFCFWKSDLRELGGKTFGVIGYGRIGHAVAGIAGAFGMRVLCCTAHPEKHPDAPVQFVPLETLLRESDFISLHCPCTPETTGMVNAGFLSQMKPTAFLVNTSRGAVVDEQALRDALDSGTIAGCGVDVLSAEPAVPTNPIAFHEKCIVTPHIAWAAFETRERLMGICRDNLRAFLAGNPIHLVN